MINLADNSFDIDDEEFTEEELAEIEALSDEELEMEFGEDFEFEDIDIDNADLRGWDEPAAFEDEAFEPQDIDEIQESLPPVSLEAAQEAVPVESVDELPPMLETTAPVQEMLQGPIAEMLDQSAHISTNTDEQYLQFEPEKYQEGDNLLVPRINISVFCESENISRLIEAASVDRRLSKAHVDILMGGIKRAIQHYQHVTTPNLIILESSGSGQELLDHLDALAELCDPSTNVIVIGEVNDISLYRELMDRGISEYLISPRNPLQITRGIARLYEDPTAPPIGRSHVFVGARGGVGSSTICHNVGWAMAEQYQSDTVILDLDLAFGTASLDFEKDPSQGLAEALTSPERLDDVLLDRLLQKCTDRLSIFSAPNLLDRDYDIPADSFEEVLDLVRRGVPNIVIDLPHLWTGWSKKILQSADEIVIVATPDLASFRNAKNLVETIKTMRTNDTAPDIILNQVGVPKRPEIPVEQFREALGIDPAAVISWDPQLFGLASTNAETVFEASAKSKQSAVLSGFAKHLLGVDNSNKRGKGLSLKSLFSNF